MDRTLINPESNPIASLSVAAAKSGGYNSPTTADNKSNNASHSIPENKSGNSEIDELLVEILGENYQDNTKSKQHKDESYDFDAPTKTKYITGSEELDDLVEAILGKGWEKDEGLPVARKIASEFSQKELDELIESILGKGWNIDDEPATSQLTSDTYQPESIPESPYSPGQIDTAHQDSAPDLNSLVESILSGGETESFVQPINTKAIDGRHSTRESKIVKLGGKSDATTSTGISSTRKVTPPAQSKQNSDHQSAHIDYSEEKRHPVLVGFLSLVVLIGALGSWKYFTSNDDVSFSNVNTTTEKIYTPATPDDVTNQTETIGYTPTAGGINSSTQSTSTALPLNQVTLPPIPDEPFIQSNEVDFSTDEHEATQPNSTILSSENIDNYDMDNTDPIIQSTTTALAENQNTSIPVQDETSIQSSKVGTEEQSTAISSNQDIQNNIIDSNTDMEIAALEAVSEEAIFTIILPVENIQPVEGNSDSKPSSEPPPTREIIIYTVVKGDTFWSIAGRYVNNPYKYTELAKQNKVKNPNLIYPGNKIRIIKIYR